METIYVQNYIDRNNKELIEKKIQDKGGIVIEDKNDIVRRENCVKKVKFGRCNPMLIDKNRPEKDNNIFISYHPTRAGEKYVNSLYTGFDFTKQPIDYRIKRENEAYKIIGSNEPFNFENTHYCYRYDNGYTQPKYEEYAKKPLKPYSINLYKK